MHRDINPNNIQFVNQQDNKIKLIDFGIAQFVSDDEFYIPRCGTPGYLGPELANYKNNEPHYNEKVDIFGCGCVFYKM